MRRETWLGLGIAGVACLLMCAGTPGSGSLPATEEAGALLGQSGMTDRPPPDEDAPPTTAPPTGTQAPATTAQGAGGSGTTEQQQAPAGTAPDAGTPNGSSGASVNPNAVGYPAATPKTGAVANPGAAASPQAGNATAPNPGTHANMGTGGTGSTGTAAPPQAPAPAASGGIAVVDAIYRGVVRSVSAKEVVIVDAGARVPLEIGAQTRILRNGEAIRVTELKEGEKVRAVVNLVGRSHTREISVLSGDEARRAAGVPLR